MRRRELLLAAATGGLLCGRTAAQPSARSARIGWLTAQRPASLVPFVQAFRGSLAELGFVEGRNLTPAGGRGFTGRPDRRRYGSLP